MLCVYVCVCGGGEGGQFLGKALKSGGAYVDYAGESTLSKTLPCELFPI